MKQIDVIGVGDIVTDAFVRLFDDKAVTYKNDEGKWLAMQYGTKIPFQEAYIVEAVGNSANAAVACARLGLKTGLVANVGGDQHGRDMITALEKNKVLTDFVRINSTKKSNYHYVLWYKEERTILIKHEEYNYHWPHFRPDETPKWIYISSISKNAIDFHDQISDWLDKHPDVKVAFQPGTFQMEAGVERLKRIYARTEVLVLNREEAVLVSGGDYDNIHQLLDKLHAIGPKIVVITDGPAGAYASDGTSRLKMPIYPDIAPPFERTGAGDAFASTFVCAIIKGNNLESALQWAPINSMNVVQKIGAQEGLLNEHHIDEFLKKAPEWYKATTF
ncbi:MAG: carbohydrate kinase family protein [bacterium]